jgi:dual specificity tyrosine-phosphorylation-regulated kinase 2/3/4
MAEVCRHPLPPHVRPPPFPQVWFLGKADVQKVKGNPHLVKTNYGYDDDRGDYHVTMHDHIGYR